MTDPAPSSLFPAIYEFLASNGLSKTKKKFKQEAKLDDNGLLKDQAPSSFLLMDLYRCYLKQHNENKSNTPEKSGKSEEKSNPESSTRKKSKKEKKAKNGSTPHEKPVVQEPESTKKGKKRKADEKEVSEQTTEPKSEQKHKKQKIAEKSEDVSMATSSAGEAKKDKKKKKKEKKEKKEQQKKEEASKSEKEKKEEVKKEEVKKEEVKKETTETKSEGFKSEVEGDDAGEDASETTASGKKKGKKGSDLTPSRFQRIKAEAISIGDNRLADNSYFAKGGESWGAKAQQDLGVVKGDRFRHEKTKKKRGSYRGGSISTEVFSVPFPDSDDE